MSAFSPILPGFYPDPSICRIDDDFYLVTSSFHYFPGVPVFHSRDLVNWRQVGHCLTRPEQLGLTDAKTSGGIYAPTLRCHDGLFYMVTTNISAQKHFLVTAADPAGEWSDPVWIDVPKNRAGTIGLDPSLFFDDDGKAYFSWTTGAAAGNDMLQAEVDVQTGALLQEPRHIWKGTGGQHAEAPHLYKINDLYYLILAEGGTSYGHMVTMARSRSLWGSWEECPHNPILTHRSLDLPVQATGHGDLVEATDGSWWMVFLGVRPDMGHPRAYHLGRESFLAPVQWDEDGWPVVGKNGRMSADMQQPPVPLECSFDQPWRDDFSEPEFRLEWNFLRNPTMGNYQLDASSKSLTLTGTTVTLDDADSPTWIGRRQQHHECRVEVQFQMDKGASGRAGLTMMMDERHHYDVAIEAAEERWVLVVRQRIGSLSTETGRYPLASPQALLCIEADLHQVRLGTVSDGFKPLATGETRYLTTEVAQGFTGVYFGLFAEGAGMRAVFRDFHYQPNPNRDE